MFNIDISNGIEKKNGKCKIRFVKIENSLFKPLWEELTKIYPVLLSDNKILAKMASDFKKPNLTHTLFSYEIEKKLKFALEANLIVAIYNPISKTRKEPFRRFKQC